MFLEVWKDLACILKYEKEKKKKNIFLIKYPSEQPCQTTENTVHSYSVTQMNPDVHMVYDSDYLDLCVLFGIVLSNELWFIHPMWEKKNLLSVGNKLTWLLVCNCMLTCCNEGRSNLTQAA